MGEKFNQKYDAIFKGRSIYVDIFAIFFGIGAWINVNATFIELPLLVAEAPEGWSLPSYLSVMVQIGNLGPIIYTVVQSFAKNKKNDAYIIYGLLVLGTISALLTAFLYNETAVIFGQEHSLALFILTFFTAITACTSSVLFMPYMGRFKGIYLVTYLVGEGLSGLLPSVVALIQGIGGASECILKNVTESGEEIYEKYTPPPRFDTMGFFLFVFAVMVCSCMGFTFLDRLKLSKKQYAAVTVTNGNNYVYESDEQNKNQEPPKKVTTTQYWILLVLIGVVSFFSNGMLNSIQSYSCLPYGNNAYHLTATLTVIINPVACFLAIFLPHRGIRPIGILSGIASILLVYVFVTAVMSPTPPLHTSVAGEVIVIVVWTLLYGLVSYIKLCITSVMRDQGGKSLVWTGGLTQIGSTLGSLLIFFLINFTHIFKEADNSAC